MLDLTDVSHSLGRTRGAPVLARAILRFPADTPTAVLGLDAPGREGLLRLLSGAERPHLGSIRLSGRDVADVRREKGRIVRVGRHGAKPSGRLVGKVIGAEAAARAGLAGVMTAQVKDLNPAQRVRLAIAAALEGRPWLVLLDAPSCELGGEPREALVRDLRKMLAQAGAVMVLAAGSAEEAIGLGGMVLVLDEGRIVQFASAADVFARPANLKAALATSWPALNTLAMMARQGAGVLADGSTFQPPAGIAWPGDGACTLAFRPADTRLIRANESCLRFVARAAGEEAVSGRAFVRLQVADANWLAPVNGARAPAPGMVVNAFIARDRLMVFDADGKALEPTPSP